MTQLTQFNPYLQTSDLQILSLKQRLRLNDFQNKERLIEMECQVQVYKTRADEYKYRYQTLLQNNGDEEVSKLLQKLKEKQNEILEMRGKEIETKSRLATKYKEIQFKSNQKLEGQVNELMGENRHLNEKIEEIKSRAVQALVEKQNIINGLTKKREEKSGEENLEMLELRDQHERQVEKYEEEIKDYELQLAQSRREYKELADRLEKNSAQYDEKLMKLECDLEEKMHSNITQVFDTYQANENNLLNDLEQLQSSLQKLEMKNNQLQIQNEKLRHQIQTEREKSTSELQNLIQHNSQEIMKIEKNYQVIIQSKSREIEDMTKLNQKLKTDFRRIVEEQVEELRNYGEEGSENRKKRGGLGSMRKLSEHSNKDVHKGVYESFNARINDNNSEKEKMRLNELKDFEENYEWLGEHESIRVTDFDEEGRGGVNDDLKQSIESIEVLNSNPYLNLNQREKSELSSGNVKDVMKESKARGYELDQADEISKLKISLEECQKSILQLNATIGVLTKQLQDSRQTVQELKQKQKPIPETGRETELKNEIESTKLYLCELQKELLSQKWKYTQLMDYLRTEIQLREIEYQKQVARATSKKRGSKE